MTALRLEGAPDGMLWRPAFLDPAAQRRILAAVLRVAAEAPFTRMTAPWGKRMSVAMTSAGRWGWVTDRAGYRYQETHPETGRPWPALPAEILEVWDAVVADAPGAPDSCLINHYVGSARMGLHSDDTEKDFAYPVVSISLGDPAVFRVGGTERKGPTRSVTLSSGDVVVMGGPARLAYHGVDRIKVGGSTLLTEAGLPDGGRINLTLRKAM